MDESTINLSNFQMTMQKKKPMLQFLYRKEEREIVYECRCECVCTFKRGRGRERERGRREGGEREREM
jgi:hypothetical protein